MGDVMYLYKDWQAEDFLNAVFCAECGLPMIEVPSEHDPRVGHYECPICDKEPNLLSAELKVNLMLQFKQLYEEFAAYKEMKEDNDGSV